MCSAEWATFSAVCNNKLYDYFILFHYVFLIFRYGKNKLNAIISIETTIYSEIRYNET